MVNKLVLIGFMGTGKSHVASGLSDRLDIPVVDVDEHIVQTTKKSISDIFAKYGEDHFRKLETTSLKTILTSSEPAIVATGGGAVLKSKNKHLMLDYGLVVALTATPEVIINRVKNDTNRPLLQGDVEQRVYDLLEKRKDSYSFAHYTVDTTTLTLEQVVDTIRGIWLTHENVKKINLNY